MKPGDIEKFQSLKIELDKDICFYLKRIKKDIKKFQKSDLNYRTLQYSPSFCIILEKGVVSSFKAIGFPFPLITFPLREIKLPKDLSVQIFLRGEGLRRFQRSQLISKS